MAKTKCQKCSGAGRISRYANIDEGRCYSCGGGGYERKGRVSASAGKVPLPSPEVARKKADEVFEDVRRFLAGEPGVEHIEDYYALGELFAFSIVDFERFQRAVPRARLRIPVREQSRFEAGLKEGVKYMAHIYEGIVADY